MEHQRTAKNGEYNRKFTNKDGREVIFRNVGKNQWEMVTGTSGNSFLDQTAFNYGSPNSLPFSNHGLYDMTSFFRKIAYQALGIGVIICQKYKIDMTFFASPINEENTNFENSIGVFYE